MLGLIDDLSFSVSELYTETSSISKFLTLEFTLKAVELSAANKANSSFILVILFFE